MSENLPEKQSSLPELAALRDSTDDPDVKRLARWAIKTIQRKPQNSELNELEVRNKKYDYYAKLAKTFVQSAMVPDGMGEADLFYVIEMGDSVGLSAPQAIQSIASINGKPALWGDGMLAVVRASSECEYIREEQSGDLETGDAEAVCITKRRGEPDEVARVFRLQDAIQAGLYPSEKKTPWKTYPKRMLQMRARAWCLRDVYADVLRGFSSAEEMQDIDYIEMPDEPKETVVEPKPDLAGEVIDQDVERPVGDLLAALGLLTACTNMAMLIAWKDDAGRQIWNEKQKAELNTAYMARRAEVKGES